MTLWENQILDMWKIHAHINLDILATIDEHDLKHTLPHYFNPIWGLLLGTSLLTNACITVKSA